ncbi:hypothetical protein PMAYCL1PPCAC_20622, partial [Pristionchus mayeri]
LRMRGKGGVEDLLHSVALLQKLSYRECILVVGLHAEMQRLDASKHLRAVEWSGNSSDGWSDTIIKCITQ